MWAACMLRWDVISIQYYKIIDIDIVELGKTILSGFIGVISKAATSSSKWGFVTPSQIASVILLLLFKLCDFILTLLETPSLPRAQGTRQRPKICRAPPSAKSHRKKKLTAKRFFAEGYLSGTRQSLFRGPTAALGKEKQPLTALLR